MPNLTKVPFLGFMLRGKKNVKQSSGILKARTVQFTNSIMHRRNIYAK